ncbi:MAG TPA: M20 family metallopeptidase [Methylomirabilota bacterium]|nr:M20 family metallopeptidase [Methylomirabilota bacterium]
MAVDTIEGAKERAREAVRAAAGELIRISREIHAHPELAFQEHHAVARMVPFLEAQGFRIERPAYGMETAFRGEWGHGPVSIAICAEYDALPEIGHACGHNLIATAGMGAAAALKAAVDPADARIVILGPPAEEKMGGKVYMVSRGCFDDIDVAMMAHPSAIDIADAPMLGVAHVDVEYRGRAVHASVGPEQGVNALDALVTAYQTIAQLRQHIRRDARIHGIITHGGAAANIVPEYAAGTFYVRAMKPAYLTELKERVRRCFEAGALATGCTVTMDWHEDVEYAPMRNNRPLVEAYRRNGEALGKQFVDIRNLSTGSSDMGNVSQVVPSIHPNFSVGQMIFNHTPEFTAAAITDAAHEGMLQTAEALAMTGVDVVYDRDLLARIKADFAGGRG